MAISTNGADRRRNGRPPRPSLDVAAHANRRTCTCSAASDRSSVGVILFVLMVRCAPTVAPERVVERPVDAPHRRGRRDRARRRATPRPTAPPRRCSPPSSPTRSSTGCPGRPLPDVDAVGRDHPGRHLRDVVRAAGDGPDPHLPHHPHRELRLRRHGRHARLAHRRPLRRQGLELLASPSPSASSVGVGTGAAIDVLVIRRFARSSRLVLTVATIGLAQILGAIGLIIGLALGTDALIGNIETPLSGSFFVRPYPIRGDHLLMLGVAPVVLAGLGWFLLAHRRRAGRAGRGGERGPRPAARRPRPPAPDHRVGRRRRRCPPSPSSPRRRSPASCPRRSSAPRPSCPVSPSPSSPASSRCRSPLAGGIGLGIAEWTIRWNVQAESIFDVTFLVVILGRPAAPHGERSTRAETGESSWDSAGVLKPIPSELRDAARGALGSTRPRRRRRCCGRLRAAHLQPVDA